MAQELWLLRHGDAEDDGGQGDAARRLSDKGERQARAAGRALAALGVEFAAVLSSPRVRARETATLAAEALDAQVEIHEPLSGGFDRNDALPVLAGLGPDDRVLLVGHEPDFSDLVHDLTGGRAEVKKGAVVALRVGRGSGELLALLAPKALKRIG
ncbi:MAG TPA: histidine phosphatase family protein [Solirubrobacteraceae bacterium]|jgi:phosphohistidine phosphatase